MDLASLRSSLKNAGGVGLVGFKEEDGSIAHVLFSSSLVVAVFRGGRHLARHEAERVVEKMLKVMESEPERVFWIPVIPYRPPIHLMFGIPLPKGSGWKEGAELGDGMMDDSQ